ncbi:MAG: DUF2780 domain-containing protein [Desulfobacterales bacterium]
MNKVQFIRRSFLVVFAILMLTSYAAEAEDGGLISLLTSNLGVSEKQAEGGAGSIFNIAKQSLSDNDFSSIAQVVPGIEKMMAAAPEEKTSSGFFDRISSIFGGQSDKVEKLSKLKDSFQELGLSGDMVGKFMPIILDYVKEKGGEKLMSTLQNAF